MRKFFGVVILAAVGLLLGAALALNVIADAIELTMEPPQAVAVLPRGDLQVTTHYQLDSVLCLQACPDDRINPQPAVISLQGSR